MRHHGNREISVNKDELIEKIRENKEIHIQEYEKAVIAYKEEALRQLEILMGKVQEGDTKVRLELTSPIDNRENYDKVIEMFEWEVEHVVKLQQDEFREYVQDETDFAVRAKISNTAYMG